MAKRRSQALVPAAARSAQPLTAVEASLADEGVSVFESVLGGREALMQVLAVASDEPEVALVTDLLLDPRYQSYSLRQLAKMVGLTTADLLTAYRKATIVQAHVQAAPIIARKLIGVVEDLMTRAQPHYLPCTICRGTGTIVPEPTDKIPNPQPRPCTACIDGQVYVLPDLDRQKLALEVAELVKPRAGITVSQTNVDASRTTSISVGGSLEQLQQAVADVLFSPQRSAAPASPIDVTPIAETEAEDESVDVDPADAAAEPIGDPRPAASADLRLPTWDTSVHD